MGMQNGAATLEAGLAVSYKAKHTLTIGSGSGAFIQRSWKHVHTKTYTRMITVTLVIIAKTGSIRDVPQEVNG